MCLRTVLAVLLLTSTAGCDRQLEPWIEREAEEPALERPVRIPGLGAPIPRSQPGVALASEPARSAAPAPIRGTLRIASEEPGLGGVLFLIARTSEVGPPLAVKRLPVGPFPMEFEIGPADLMMPGIPFAGAIRLTARIDSDGDPLTTEVAELRARLPSAVKAGARDVELVLRRGGS